MDKELWKPVVGYEGLYDVSTFGRVKSVRRGLILKPWKSRGYFYLSLNKNGITSKKCVHLLVAEAFLGPRPDGYDIDHIDHNRANNRLENIRYLPMGENRIEGNKAQINHPKKSKTVLQYTLDGEFVKEWPSASEIQRQTGWLKSEICHCCNQYRNCKTAYGFIWKYGQNTPDMM